MHWALSKRIQITVAFSAITLVAIFLLLPADTDVQTTKTSSIHDAIPQFDNNATINDITPQFDSNATINDANNILAIEMYKRIEPNQNKNIFFSPLGILTVFAMMYEGADGNTASQLESVFGFSKDDSHRWTSYYDLTKSFNDNSEDYDINLVNAVWLLNKFQPFPEYVDTLSKYYLAVSDTISDPQLGAKRINSWAHENTNGKISNIISQDTLADPNLRMILTNAVYFKGLWEEPFEKLSTKDRDFWTSSTKSITVPTMHKTDFYNLCKMMMHKSWKYRTKVNVNCTSVTKRWYYLENALKSDTLYGISKFLELVQKSRSLVDNFSKGSSHNPLK